MPFHRLNELLTSMSIAMLLFVAHGCEPTDNGDTQFAPVTEQCPDPANMFLRAATGECACKKADYVVKNNRCVQCNDSCSNVPLDCGYTECGSYCGCDDGRTCSTGICVPAEITGCRQLHLCVLDCLPKLDPFNCTVACSANAGVLAKALHAKLWNCMETNCLSEEPQDQSACGSAACSNELAVCYDHHSETSAGTDNDSSTSADGSIGDDDTSGNDPSDGLAACKPDQFGSVDHNFVEGDFDGDGSPDDNYNDENHAVVMDFGTVYGDVRIAGKYLMDWDKGIQACADGEVDRYRMNFNCVGEPKVWLSWAAGNDVVNVTTDYWTFPNVTYEDGVLDTFTGEMEIEVACGCDFGCSGYTLKIEFF